jgi:hypothetical protein
VITFVPILHSDSGEYKMGIFKDGIDQGVYLHGIDAGNGEILAIKSLALAVPIGEGMVVAKSTCDQLQERFDRGELGANLRHDI